MIVTLKQEWLTKLFNTSVCVFSIITLKVDQKQQNVHLNFRNVLNFQFYLLLQKQIKFVRK